MTTSPLFKRVSTWAVEVSRDGERILTIGSNILAGADMTPENETVVRDAAHHLLSFLGDGFAASPETTAEEVETLRKRVKELEEALAPFSLIGGPLNKVTEGVFPDDASARFLNLGELKAKHFRVAATALDRARAKGGG